ncbi:MAG: hypothetical protein M1G31_06480 [Pseudanabaena sp. Salubria-1]|nr:hypothetical protein [Pseudanabaena sp. Salubria-1]
MCYQPTTPEFGLKHLGKNREFDLLVWIIDPDANEPIQVRLIFGLPMSLDLKVLEFPFPTRELILQS